MVLAILRYSTAQTACAGDQVALTEQAGPAPGDYQLTLPMWLACSYPLVSGPLCLL